MSRKLVVMAVVLAAMVVTPASAQFGDLLDKVKKKAEDTVEQRAEQKTQETTNQAIDKAEGKGTEKAPQPSSAKQPQAGSAAQPQGGSGLAQGGGAGQAAAGGAPVELYANEFDFVPGDKVLFFEDFSDTEVGEYPVKWKRADGGETGVEVIERGGKHWLRLARAKAGASYDLVRTEFQDLPKKFTLEFDALIDYEFSVLYGTRSWIAYIRRDSAVSEAGTQGSFQESPAVRHVAISVSGTYLKVYVDGQRVLVDPDGVKRPLKQLGLGMHSASDGAPHMFTNFRLAEGGKDYRKELVSLGRIVTHGITFDTGSDVIKPESGPTLNNILKIMQENQALRFEVQGHTDNQGSAKVNVPLSERRAAAVKAWLVKQGVAPARLRAKGLAATKPIDTNETAEGRANNRRVEFVKF